MSSLPERARVVIVGGGFAGAATAYHLACAGIGDVVLLEREASCGYHASGRNAALCRQLTDDDQVTALAMAGAAFMRQPPAGFSPAPLVVQTGSLLASGDPAALDALVARAAAHALPCERLPPERVLAAWPRLAGLPMAGAVLFPTDGVIDIHALLQGFLAGARAAGARVELSTEVTRIRAAREPLAATVETSRGSITAACVVNAGGAWADELGRRAGAGGAGLRSYQRHVFLTERVVSLDHDAPFVWYLDAEEMYARPAESGYLLCGCDAAETPPCDPRVSPEAAAMLHERLRRVAPWLADLPIARSWACLRTFSPDGRPVIGWDHQVPWLFWVAGLGGHGATACPAIGAAAAEAISQKLAVL